MVTDDERAVRQRLAELEAEVKAEAAAATARKQAAIAKRSAQVEAAPSPPVRTQRGAKPQPDSDATDDLGEMLELAGRASKVKRELQKRPGKGEKSWIASGLASLALGPIGWLYAGAWREAVPASLGWAVLVSIAAKFLPSLLTVPALLVALPASAIAGVTYALQHNRQGARTRLFGGDKPKLLQR